MDELNEEIKLTIHTMQTDIDDGAHDELQGHLYSLLEMKRNEIQQRLAERSWFEPALGVDKAIPLLTTEELWNGGWWCADVSKECADALKSKGLRVFNSPEWGTEGSWDCCIMDVTGDDVITRGFSDNFVSKKQIKRIGNDFYWSKP